MQSSRMVCLKALCSTVLKIKSCAAYMLPAACLIYLWALGLQHRQIIPRFLPHILHTHCTVLSNALSRCYILHQKNYILDDSHRVYLSSALK